MRWKYGMILVEKDQAGDESENIHELVELYEDDDGNWNSFCKARIMSVVELERAHEDVKRDGVNTWFYENGEFSDDNPDGDGPGWRPNDPVV